MCREEMNGCKDISTVNWPSRQEAAWAKLRELEPSERTGHSMRPAIWSETKRSCVSEEVPKVGRICLAVNSLCGMSIGRGGVRCSR